MRGESEWQATLMLGLTPHGFIPRDRPLPRIKPVVATVLGRISSLFDQLCAAGERPSMLPEHLLKPILSGAKQLSNRIPYVVIRCVPLDQCLDAGVLGHRA